MGFLRLSLPLGDDEGAIPELRGRAVIREVHVYGRVAGIGDGQANAQHKGLGRGLVAEAVEVARQEGFRHLAVISAVGTREYYRSLGFEDGRLYQVRSLEGRTASAATSLPRSPSSRPFRPTPGRSRRADSRRE